MIKKLFLCLLFVFSAQGVILRNGTDVSQESIDKVWPVINKLYKKDMRTLLGNLSYAAESKDHMIIDRYKNSISD